MQDSAPSGLVTKQAPYSDAHSWLSSACSSSCSSQLGSLAASAMSLMSLVWVHLLWLLVLLCRQAMA